MRLTTLLILIICTCGCTAPRTANIADLPPTTDTWNTPPETCNVVDSTDWQNVAVYLMERQKEPKWLDLRGEHIINESGSIATIDELPTATINTIKMTAARYGGCVVFVDMYDFYGSEMFPMREKDQLYFYWGVPK